MIDELIQKRLNENWRAVRDEVLETVERCGRPADSVHVIGVSKYVEADITLGLIRAGCNQLGESRPQRIWQKAESLEADLSQQPVQWHLIGHLQRNKVRRILQYRPLVHSVDSERLLLAIADEAASHEDEVTVLLEVNISGDEAKTGFAVDDLLGVLDRLPAAGVAVRGLMAMAGWGTDSKDAREQFDSTRQLRDRLVAESGHALPELSMGMSGDFREAIAAGATMVRIGSRLFEGVIDRR